MKKKAWLAVAALVGMAATVVSAGELDGYRFDKGRNVTGVTPDTIRRFYFPPNVSRPVEFKAAALKAYSVAWGAFLRAPEVPQARKDLDRYLAVYVSEDAADYYVYFLPKQRYPSEKGRRVVVDGVIYSGQQVKYVIRKSDDKIVGRTLYLL